VFHQERFMPRSGFSFVLDRRVALVCAAVLVVLAGCGRIRWPGSSSTPTPVTAKDGSCRVVVPAGWSAATGLHDQADLQVADKRRDAYLVVLTEPKENFGKDVTFRDHSRMTLTAFQKTLTELKTISGPTEMQINGRPAIQYVYSGVTSDRLRIQYVHTTVDGNKSFHQVIGWTTMSNATRNRPAINQVIESFQDLS
jgi:hypothetical protein